MEMNNTSDVTKAMLLVNLGTPTAPTVRALRTFLGEFLADRRVVDVPRFIWLPILYGFILPFRPYKVLPLYQNIWIKKGSGVVINGKDEGSPLTLYTESLTARVNALVKKQSNGTTVVRLAMRYGTNNIKATLKALHDEHPTLRELVVLPLFPHYSSSTSAAVYDEVFSFYTDTKRRCVPALRTIRDYAENPVFIESISNKLLAALEKYVTAKTGTAEKWQAALPTHMADVAIIITYHSIPVHYVAEGDDYPQRCEATTRCITAYIEAHTGVPLGESIAHVYQSQFGNQPWIGPKLVDAVAALPAEQDDAQKIKFCSACNNKALLTKRVKVCFAMSPGFAVDCVETIHEIEDEAGELFEEHGGKELIYVPCLNDSEAHVKTVVSVLHAAN